MKVFIKCNWVYGFVRVFICLLMINISACMSPENQYVTVEGQADQIVLSNEYFLGEELYKDNCAYCHEGGIPKAPHRDWLAKMSPDTVLRALNEGVMKRVAESLSLQERRYVVEYITGVNPVNYVLPSGPEPCSGKPRTFDQLKQIGRAHV